MTQPSSVKTALEAYARALKSDYSPTTVDAGAEEQLKPPIKALLEACASLAPKVGRAAPGIRASLEARVKGVGRPDVAVELNELLNGYVELKAPGKGADPTKFKAKSHDKAQWEKFKLLPNLIYTDGLEWRLYRWDGTKAEAVGKPVKFGDYLTHGSAAVTDADVQDFSGLLQTFFIDTGLGLGRAVGVGEPPGKLNGANPLPRRVQPPLQLAEVLRAEVAQD